MFLSVVNSNSYNDDDDESISVASENIDDIDFSIDDTEIQNPNTVKSNRPNELFKNNDTRFKNKFEDGDDDDASDRISVADGDDGSEDSDLYSFLDNHKSLASISSSQNASAFGQKTLQVKKEDKDFHRHESFDEFSMSEEQLNEDVSVSSTSYDYSTNALPPDSNW